jgi:hypothetical protein
MLLFKHVDPETMLTFASPFRYVCTYIRYLKVVVEEGYRMKNEEGKMKRNRGGMCQGGKKGGWGGGGGGWTKVHGPYRCNAEPIFNFVQIFE